jgi:hypothetical protein
MIKIRAFKATDEPATCHQFLDGHVKVLAEFNLENISTNTPKWITHNGTYVVIAEYNGEVIGGVRMQIADRTFPLPVEEAVAHFDPKIYTLIADKMADGGACELCGLWNARILPPNLGLTRMMSAAAISLANAICVKNVFAICAGYTLGTAMKMGFVIQKSVGHNGEFVYPNSSFKARVLCMDGFALDTSNIENKTEILSLRNNPDLVTNFVIEGTDVPVVYDLSLKQYSL